MQAISKGFAPEFARTCQVWIGPLGNFARKFDFIRQRRQIGPCSAHFHSKRRNIFFRIQIHTWKLNPGCSYFAPKHPQIGKDLLGLGNSARGQFLKRLASTRKLKLTCEGWNCECSQVTRKVSCCDGYHSQVNV